MSPARISSSKITRPDIREVFPRNRLFQLIDKSRKQSIIWITGPAGSGKTTLITSYLEERQLPCLWYQMDKGDGEIASFFYYMGLAVKKAAPRKRKSLPLLTPEYLLDIPTFTNRYFENVYTFLKMPTIIVFDNYQDVPADSMLHEVICEGLMRIPEGITIIFGSREDPPKSMARLLAANALEFIDWKQLRFTTDESKRIIQLHTKNSLSDEKVQRIHQITRGWAAGLILLLLRTRREGLEAQQLSPHSLSEIFNYFATEIVKKMDKSKKDFLLKTAFLPRMTTKMAKDLTGNHHAEPILSELNAKNCFIERRYYAQLIYQYHPLFKEFLLARAKDELSATAISQLQHKAALLLEASGQIEDAAELYYTIGEWKNLSQLIFKHAQFLLEQGRNQTLERWIKWLPDEIQNNTSWICYWMGSSLSLIRPLEAVHYFKKAYTLFKKERAAVGLFLTWSFIVDCYIHEHNHMPLLEPWLKELQGLLTLYPQFPSPEIEARVTFSMFIALLYYLPEEPPKPTIAVWAKKSEAFREHITDFTQQMMISNFLIYYYCISADLPRAASLLAELKQKSDKKNIPPFSVIIFRLMEATYCCFVGDFERCRKLVDDGLKIAEQSGAHITPLMY